ncbi:unnamed protein product [Rangifer tarandus platyrhynchus]|uniref:Uncharacterized protein n=1 Tax=Rangifer tarandus platyrhynchus TaxID=3082113 RepID=A0AC59YS59_RANTA
MGVRFLVGKIAWSGKWQLTPVFLPEEFHGQRSLIDFRPKVPIQLSTKSCQVPGKRVLKRTPVTHYEDSGGYCVCNLTNPPCALGPVCYHVVSLESAVSVCVLCSPLAVPLRPQLR